MAGILRRLSFCALLGACSSESPSDVAAPRAMAADAAAEPDANEPEPLASEPAPTPTSALPAAPENEPPAVEPNPTLPDAPIEPEAPEPAAEPASPGPVLEPDTGEPEPSPEPQPVGAVTWHNAIAPLVIGKCSGCHRDGGIAPFSLETYEQASTLAPLLRSAIELRIMPPWGARSTQECQPRFTFKDDLSLSDEQITTFGGWVDADTPLGDPETAAPVPSPPDLELGDPSLSLPLPDIGVEGRSDRFICFSVDPALDEDAWVVATQVTPGNPAIVHHVLTFVDAAGESAALANEDGYYDCFGGPLVSDPVLLGAWAPGGVPFRTPPEVAMSVPAGSRIIVNVHYHPTGAGTEVDSGTRVDFAFTETEPAYDGQIVLIGNFSSSGVFGELLPGENDPPDGVAFSIPPGARAHVERMRFQIPPIGVAEGIIWGVGTHMHYVGTDMLMTLQRPAPSTGQPSDECLLQTPNWDFNWQRGYLYDAPLPELPTAGPGDILELRCSYDNSLENPFVREALDEQGLSEPREVVLGEESLDEMCLGLFAVAYPR